MTDRKSGGAAPSADVRMVTNAMRGESKQLSELIARSDALLAKKRSPKPDAEAPRAAEECRLIVPGPDEKEWVVALDRANLASGLAYLLQAQACGCSRVKAASMRAHLRRVRGKLSADVAALTK